MTLLFYNLMTRESKKHKECHKDGQQKGSQTPYEIDHLKLKKKEKKLEKGIMDIKK